MKKQRLYKFMVLVSKRRWLTELGIDGEVMMDNNCTNLSYDLYIIATDVQSAIKGIEHTHPEQLKGWELPPTRDTKGMIVSEGLITNVVCVCAMKEVVKLVPDESVSATPPVSLDPKIGKWYPTR